MRGKPEPPFPPCRVILRKTCTPVMEKFLFAQEFLHPFSGWFLKRSEEVPNTSYSRRGENRQWPRAAANHTLSQTRVRISGAISRAFFFFVSGGFPNLLLFSSLFCPRDPRCCKCGGKVPGSLGRPSVCCPLMKRAGIPFP